MFTIETAALGALLAAVLGGGQLPERVWGVSTDTRSLGAGSLFVALRGERFDGHDYVGQAFEQGAILAIVERPVPQPHLLVADTLIAYQALARWWREHFALPVVAVTGSVGKTTTRELIRAVLATAGPVLAPPKNENNDVGVPKLLLGLNAAHRFCVVEMGMRGPGEIDRLARCALPTVGLITNIGSAHIGRLGSYEAIAAAKCELLAALATDIGVAILNAEDERLLATARRFWGGRVQTFGLEGSDADLTGHFDGQLLWVRGVPFVPPLPGRHNLLNFIAALAVAVQLGLDLEQVRSGLKDLQLPEGRSRLLTLSEDIQLIDETYNSAPESARAALEWLAQLPGGRRIAVLGQMRELGDFSYALHHRLGKQCRALGIDELVVLEAGEDTAALLAGAQGMASTSLPDHRTIATYLAATAQPGDRILFKASRAVGLEVALTHLQQLLQDEKS
ncbi:UDP-N-acetylmuramoyl-tripeptide--D-alanyl-D-alanine ligase [Gloeobacter kilaueensis]|uniref:UDP-N-acetylmuramoyl-tripeptide--D-alanyl-D-alanine ligase n=1 Tax=Gloeobacter kilaueensis (strain ATCC BAA-2537 / CCAP 1431/1 / ULC 316 / JS1) TaxID=1183438 RepID=U5QIZ6_GLOK1|nr:UDP-N-acetylmuramoyl-tripeptide--D-alanyl-D-alanine ligase [Gloeobacter kilaueensis]AGY58952.1 UDP-N-acetylmuramoyl-tripeptide--D-alanyl-D-alanine ligase [Gloeobacter kilaueensis JS1]